MSGSQLKRTTVAQYYGIKVPIWHGPYKDKPACVGLDKAKLKQHNEVEITYTRKDGSRIWPDKYYFPGRLEMFFTTQKMFGLDLVIVPINCMSKLERV